jgi:hypothetical protein
VRLAKRELKMTSEFLQLNKPANQTLMGTITAPFGLENADPTDVVGIRLSEAQLTEIMVEGEIKP